MSRNIVSKAAPADQGLSLLELVVAVFVLAVGTLTVLTAVDQSRVSIGEERQRLLAGVVADNRAEALRLPGARVLPKTVQMGGLSFTVSQQLRVTAGGLTQATIVVRAPGGPGAQRVAWLPAGRGGG